MRTSLSDNFIRYASRFTIEEIYSTKKDYIKDSLVLPAVRTEFSKLGIDIKKISYNSTIRLPKFIQSTLESKTNAIQRAIQVENEVREEEAKAKKSLIVAESEAKQLLIKSQAESEANKLKQNSLTPLLIQHQAIEKWNGQLPTMMNNGQNLPFIQIK